MFKLIETMVQRLAGRGRVWLGDMADDHIQLYEEHVERRMWLQEADAWAAERAAVQADWDGLPEAERAAVIDWCDARDAEGRLEDHRYYRQWLALRMEGYVGD